MKRLLLTVAAIAAFVQVVAAQVVIGENDKARAKELVSKMTLAEKVDLLGGKYDGFHTLEIKRLGIPSVRMADGPQGVRNKTNSTYYPSGISLAASWNREAAHGVGQGIGYDAKARGVGIMLCPGVNIYRSALCGRNFEYYGEDPYLASEMACKYIEGIQENKVMATIKHFVANNQEYDRHWVSSIVDERTLNEIYFPTFRAAVEKAHVAAVMTSYNPVNGEHAAESSYLINDNLRSWGHEGIVMSDWTSTYTTLGCLTGGLDLEMPRAFEMTLAKIKPLLENGVVQESLIDEKCCHILQSFIAYGFLDIPMKDESIPEDYELSRKLAYEAALEAPVLLENNGILPIKPSKKNNIVVLGPNADYVAFGGGSGKMDPFPERNITIWEALSAAGKGYKMALTEDKKSIKEASAVIICAGFSAKTESEGRDRTYTLPEGQDELILKACELNKNVIVVINSGGEVDMSKWQDKVAAIIMAWYGGQEGGKALADIITGKVSPSGRLPFTFWGTLESNPVYAYYPKREPESYIARKRRNGDPMPRTEYGEGIFVGYRGVGHFASVPKYAFGYGLTYSAFEYSALSVQKNAEGVDVTFSVKNTGNCTASEVAQVYVAPQNAAVIRPAHELKGFEKIALQKGESKTVTVHLGQDAFSYYDIASHAWKLDKCNYTIQVGASSADIRLSEGVSL